MPPERDRGPSRTARMVAAFRARAAREHPGLMRDPWAEALAGDDGDALADRYLASFPHMVLWLGVRTAWIDALLAHHCGAGALRQIVLLGAGLDSRAARHPLPGCRYFEVDQPASQSDKLERLRRIEGYPVDAAVHVSCDFEHDDFFERLEAAGLRLDRPTFFVWEGVTYYLSEAAVRATLSRIATGSHERSLVVFDYVRRKLVSGEPQHERTARMRSFVVEVGEPMRFGTDDPLPLLYECGFRFVRTTSFDSACLSLTGTYERVREFRFQSMALAGRRVPAGEPGWEPGVNHQPPSV